MLGKRMMVGAIAALAMSSAFATVQALKAEPQLVGKADYLRFCRQKVAELKAKNPKVVFLGDSITYFWETPGRGKEILEAYFTNSTYNAVCFGYPGDHTENLLWRLQEGMLDGTDPKAFVVLIGTNNTYHRLATEPVEDTVAGITAVVAYLREHFPNAKILLHPIMPNGFNPKKRLQDEQINDRLQRLADGDRVRWLNFYGQFMLMDGKVDATKFVDGLHPSPAGYEIWAKTLLPELRTLMGSGK